MQKQIKFGIDVSIIYDTKQNRMISQNELTERITITKKHLITGLFVDYKGIPEEMLNNWFTLELLKLKKLKLYPSNGKVEIRIK